MCHDKICKSQFSTLRNWLDVKNVPTFTKIISNNLPVAVNIKNKIITPLLLTDGICRYISSNLSEN
jgi:hypothetical protein